MPELRLKGELLSAPKEFVCQSCGKPTQFEAGDYVAHPFVCKPCEAKAAELDNCLRMGFTSQKDIDEYFHGD